MDTITVNGPLAMVEIREEMRPSSIWGASDYLAFAAACTVCGWHGYWWPDRTEAEDDAETHRCAETETVA